MNRRAAFAGLKRLSRGGTRITVELILEKLAEGESIEQIASEHPNLTAEQIRTALEYATMVFKSDVIYSVGA